MPTQEQWDEYLDSVRRYLATDRLDSDEINYKLEIGKKLQAARSALLADDEWFDLFKEACRGQKGHPMDWRDAVHLLAWLDRDREAGREALRTLWSDGDVKPGDIRGFSEQFPSDAGPGGTGTRLRTISVVFVYRVEARKSAKWCTTISPIAGLVRMCRYVQYGSRGRQTGRFEGARARG